MSTKTAKTASATAPASTNSNTSAASAGVQIENAAGIKYPFFAEVKNGETLTVAGNFREVDEKSTPYGPVKRYKGDFIIRHNVNGVAEIKPVAAVVKDGKEVSPAITGRAAVPASVKHVRSGTVYFPAQIGEQLLERARKIEGGWENCEFKFSATKSNGGFPSISWSVEPRVEADRVLSLLNS